MYAVERGTRLSAKSSSFQNWLLTGYPPEDLLLRDDFILEVERGLERIGSEIEGVTADHWTSL